jgi:hypothetical protein
VELPITDILEGVDENVVDLVNPFGATRGGLHAFNEARGLGCRFDVHHDIGPRYDLRDLLLDTFGDVVRALEGDGSSRCDRHICE